MIAGSGSGERLDRKEYKRAKRRVRSNKFDLVLTEDIGRIVRRMHAMLFCELCEDHGTRLIAINDAIDTAQEGWEFSSFFASFRHTTYNRDIALRIRRSLRNRFSDGLVFQIPIFGYIKPKSEVPDSAVSKDPAAEPIYDEWFRRLEEGASYAEIADWLKASGVPVGPYCRSKEWTGKMVRRITHNPTLKGLRERNRKKSKRVNRTGRHHSVNAPIEELLERWCPHLAFIEPERYDRVIAMLAERNGKYTAGTGPSGDPRRGRPKKRTLWPGQHVTCGICGRLYRYGGHGQNDHLMCRGAYEYKCWNGITVDGPITRQKMADAILAKLESLPEFEIALVQRIQNRPKNNFRV
jgi:site-specific DNA recombinase